MPAVSAVARARRERRSRGRRLCAHNRSDRYRRRHRGAVDAAAHCTSARARTHMQPSGQAGKHACVLACERARCAWAAHAAHDGA
eukprot:scaffold209_cov396-Prasinococcus_capsulatus_cf.AAC.1